MFLLLFNSQDPHILAIQKADTEGYPWRNQVALPGGHLERKDSSPIEAAYRELKEELNITRDQVEFMGSIGHFQTVIKHRDIEVFVGLWNRQETVHYDSKEISRILEIPLRTLYQNHLANNYHGRIPDSRELQYSFQNIVIWGATARIVHHFIELIFPLLEKSG